MQSMLAELVGWYAGNEENRRRYPRVKREYPAEYSFDGGRSWRPLRGQDLSGGGMCVYSDREIPPVIVDVAMTLGDRKVRLKALPVWNTEVTQGYKRVRCYGLQFTSVNGGDWDAIMSWITGGPLATVEGLKLRIDDAKVEKLLPKELRERLLAELVKRKRHDPHGSPKAQFDYGGIVRANGTPMHSLMVHSKVKVAHNHEEMRFSTRFLCDEAGNEVVVLN
jgi:hypothetical protein